MRNNLTRRQVLALLGVGAVAPVVGAGCSRSEEAADGGTELHLISDYQAPPKGHFNFLGGVSDQLSLGYVFDLFLLPGAMYLWDAQQYTYFLADDSSALSPDGKTFTYKVRDGLTWSDGSAITAADVYATWSLRWANSHAVFDYVESFEQTDDMTVTFHISTPAPVTEYYLLKEHPIPVVQFKEWADQADQLRKDGAAIEDKAVSTISEKVAAFRPKPAVVSGPFNFEYDNVGNAALFLEKNDKGYLADKIPFDRIKVYAGQANDVLPVVLDGEIDFSEHFFAPASQKSILDAGYRILRTPIKSGPALFFNFGSHPEFRDKRVRQAFAHAIDRKINGTVSFGEESGIPPELMTGMSDTQVPTWMSAADQQKLNHYEFDRDKATQLLTDAGWTQDGDSWKTPEGKTAKYDILVPSDYIDWSASGQNAGDQLTDFGIPVTLLGNEATQVDEFGQRGKFQLMIWGWGSSSNPYPNAAFRGPLIDRNKPGLEPDPGIDFDMQQDTEIVGSIDLEEATTLAGQGKDDAELKANVTRLALAFNELLPVIPLVERYATSPIMPDRVSGWPSDDDPILKNSIYGDCYLTMLIYDGTLKPA